MDRAKLFLENFFMYGGINALTKLLPLLLLPLLTRVIKNPSEYGIFDLFLLLVNFGVTIAQFGMYDAFFREYYEYDDISDKIKVFSTALNFVLIICFLLIVTIFFFEKLLANIFEYKFDYLVYILLPLSILIVSTKNIFSSLSRIKNDRKIFFVAALVNSAAFYCIAITIAYFYTSTSIAIIFAFFVGSVLVLSIFFGSNRGFYKIKCFDRDIIKKLLFIGIPLLPISLIQFFNDSASRYFITNNLGVKELGIYSVGLKMGSISSFIQSAFVSGWYFYSFSTMREHDQVENNSEIFELLGIISIIFFFAILPFSNSIFNLFYNGEYVLGYKVFPFLFLCPLLIMLIITVSNQFIIIKKTILSSLPMFIALIINLILNYKLIKATGIKGPAISLTLGYLTALIISVAFALKYKLIKISSKFCFIGSMFLFVFIMFIYENKLTFFMGYLVIIVGLILYRNDFLKILKKIKSLV